MTSDSTSLDVIRLWAAAAWADGRIAARERSVLERFIGNLPLSAADRETALGYLDRPVELDAASGASLTAAEREGIYRAACKLTAIDRHVADEERAFLVRLRAALKLDDAAAAGIERAVGL